eukprot:scaffold1571_cov124-Isochrysis_galbana.AAC.3
MPHACCLLRVTMFGGCALQRRVLCQAAARVSGSGRRAGWHGGAPKMRATHKRQLRTAAAPLRLHRSARCVSTLSSILSISVRCPAQAQARLHRPLLC